MLAASSANLQTHTKCTCSESAIEPTPRRAPKVGVKSPVLLAFCWFCVVCVFEEGMLALCVCVLSSMTRIIIYIQCFSCGASIYTRAAAISYVTSLHGIRMMAIRCVCINASSMMWNIGLGESWFVVIRRTHTGRIRYETT